MSFGPKFHIAIENTNDIQFVIDNHPTILLFYIFFTNKCVQKHNENVFIKTLDFTFIFKVMHIDLNYACHFTNFQMM
jgi:hypothetical protein